MIYTTYFANLKNLPPNIRAISICGRPPAFYKGPQYKKLAPKYDFFVKWKQDHDDDAYVKEFKKQVLEPLNVINVLHDLWLLAGKSTDIALVCYEKPGDFCHRHLVAEWLNKNGCKCEEFKI